MRKPRNLLNLAIVLAALAYGGTGRACAQSIRVAVLDLGETGRAASERLFATLSSDGGFHLVDRDEARAAARGAGYTGSLNMTLQEARDLGGALGCDFYITGEAQTLRRSPSAGPAFYEAYASVFVVSAHTGKLVMWDRPSLEAASSAEAEKALMKELTLRGPRYAGAIRAAQETERAERAQRIESAGAPLPVIEEAPEDEAAARRAGIRLPQPYRRLRPVYPETAARAEAEATVDVELDIDAAGEVARALVVRWAGFGLDESTLATVRQLHFTPPRRDGEPVPMRVLLRYNFRRPPKEGKR